MLDVFAAYRLRVLLALPAGGLVVTVVFVAAMIIVAAMAGAGPGASGDFGAVY